MITYRLKGLSMRIAMAALVSILIGVASGSAKDAQRLLRSTGHSAIAVEPVKGELLGIDAVDTLKYENGQYPYFLWIPNEFGDDYYNVRFTPPFAPYWILGVQVALFDMNIFDRNNERVGGPAGTPGMRVFHFESGVIDDESGFPVAATDSVDVPYNADTNFPEICRADSIIWNYIDLTRLGISSQEQDDFHIGVTHLPDGDEHDTLAIFMDNGEGRIGTDRSIMMNGNDSSWIKLEDVYRDDRVKPNFSIRVVLSDTRPPNVAVDPEGILRPGTILLNPAYPNPFNSTTSLRFSVPGSLPYRIELFDRQGRRVALLGQGSGGANVVSLDAASLVTGTYFVTLSTPVGLQSQPVILVR